MTLSIETEELERLHLIDDRRTGLVAAIAVHSTVLGPAAGGCRFWSYSSKNALVADAIRLARGMSYKNAMAGLPLGGGKAVILRRDGAIDREALFAAFGDMVAELNGMYITAEDVGTSVQDMRAIRSRTRFVAGLDSQEGKAGGDPSPWTALGIFEGMKAAARMRGIDLNGATVAVQGVGNVGGGLCRLLAKEGARIILADVDQARAASLARELGARQAGVEEILQAEAEILAPCALGAILNDETIPLLRAEVICGGANNQLAEERHGTMLHERGCLYVPDYVVNAGGIINVSAEYLGESANQVEGRVREIAPRVIEILRRANERGLPSNRVADDMARETIERGRQQLDATRLSA